MIPVSVITGFLGSGKTTLLRRVLRDPRYADSAVIVNEFGEIPLDHELVAASEETLLSTATGCLCCTVRSDLTATLLDLLRRREAGEVPPYARVLVETSGLADPAPILHALMTDKPVAATHRLDSVVTLVDALHGAATLARHPEAERQAMLADRILLTKPDLAPDTAPLVAQLRRLNATAPIEAAVHGTVPPERFFAPGQNAADSAALVAWLTAAGHAARHSPGLACIAIERDAPLPALALTLWMQALAEHAGARLLRLKGLVRIAEAPERPAAIHAVQHVLHPPEWLEGWPSADRRSRIVLIGQGIPRHFPARLLAAIEAEVEEEMARRAGPSLPVKE
ncbi:MAG: GTP-binding protein [Acetobacteraceae bacterium]|nr:GTP-binding protein [Acetobacteraceae bacterium]